MMSQYRVTTTPWAYVVPHLFYDYTSNDWKQLVSLLVTAYSTFGYDSLEVQLNVFN